MHIDVLFANVHSLHCCTVSNVVSMLRSNVYRCVTVLFYRVHALKDVFENVECQGIIAFLLKLLTFAVILA